MTKKELEEKIKQLEEKLNDFRETILQIDRLPLESYHIGQLKLKYGRELNEGIRLPEGV